MTNQPIWKFAGRIGDNDPISYGGGFVYEDETGVYPPELVYIEPASDEDWKRFSDADNEDALPLTVYRIVLDPPRFKTYTAQGQREAWRIPARALPANERGKTWEWHPEWYVAHLGSVAESFGTTKMRLLRDLFSKNAVTRALAYHEMIVALGPFEFDSYPLTLTQGEARTKYAEELKTK
jgi:hypothetical protein